jgi:Transglutaminase-like superfamily
VTAPGRHSATARRRARVLAGLVARPRDGWLALQMAGWRLLLPVLKRRRSLPWLVALMWDGSGSERENPDREAYIAELATLVFRSRHIEKFGNCLDRSLVLYRYLSAVGANPELVVGMKRMQGAVEGHAWVEVRGRPVEESPEVLDGLARVTTFGAPMGA